MKRLVLSYFLFQYAVVVLGQTGLITSKAMVVSAREEASQIGVEIMQQGGNALTPWSRPNWRWQWLIRTQEILRAVDLWSIGNLMVKSALWIIGKSTAESQQRHVSRQK